MTAKRVLLADEHPVILEGLRQILCCPEFEIVGAVGEARALVKAACEVQPDLIIADICIAQLSGIHALRQIRQTQKISKIIFFTIHHEAPFAVEALKAGASGYILKTSSREELLAGVRAVLRGEIYVSAAFRDRVSSAVALGRSKTSTEPDLLTPRELDVLRLLAQGKQVKQIATVLHISPKTVVFHKENMKNRLGVKTVAELAVYATKRRINE